MAILLGKSLLHVDDEPSRGLSGDAEHRMSLSGGQTDGRVERMESHGESTWNGSSGRSSGALRGAADSRGVAVDGPMDLFGRDNFLTRQRLKTESRCRSAAIDFTFPPCSLFRITCLLQSCRAKARLGPRHQRSCPEPRSQAAKGPLESLPAGLGAGKGRQTRVKHQDPPHRGL